MNVIEEARKRVKSNAGGMGAGSRSVISNVVHGSRVSEGNSPRRAKS